MAIVTHDKPRVSRGTPRRQQADPKLPAGTNFCRCAECGAYFSTIRAFDEHRVGLHRVPGDRRCLQLGGMRSRGLRLNSQGYWTRGYIPNAEIARRLATAICSGG